MGIRSAGLGRKRLGFRILCLGNKSTLLAGVSVYSIQYINVISESKG